MCGPCDVEVAVVGIDRRADEGEKRNWSPNLIGLAGCWATLRLKG